MIPVQLRIAHIASSVYKDNGRDAPSLNTHFDFLGRETCLPYIGSQAFCQEGHGMQ